MCNCKAFPAANKIMNSIAKYNFKFPNKCKNKIGTRILVHYQLLNCIVFLHLCEFSVNVYVKLFHFVLCRGKAFTAINNKRMNYTPNIYIS